MILTPHTSRTGNGINPVTLLEEVGLSYEIL